MCNENVSVYFSIIKFRRNCFFYSNQLNANCSHFGKCSHLNAVYMQRLCCTWSKCKCNRVKSGENKAHSCGIWSVTFFFRLFLHFQQIFWNFCIRINLIIIKCVWQQCVKAKYIFLKTYTHIYTALFCIASEVATR